MKNFHAYASVSYFRNFVFGVEDSLVSTVGLLSGIAIAGVPKSTIFLTGVILIFVEAVSMAAGSFLSEYSAEGYAQRLEEPSRRDFVASGVMFFSYFISGFIPLFPYAIFPVNVALAVSIVLSLLSLFMLGVVGGKISKIPILKNAFRVALVGGAAIIIGMLAGTIMEKI